MISWMSIFVNHLSLGMYSVWLVGWSFCQPTNHTLHTLQWKRQVVCATMMTDKIVRKTEGFATPNFNCDCNVCVLFFILMCSGFDSTSTSIRRRVSTTVTLDVDTSWMRFYITINLWRLLFILIGPGFYSTSSSMRRRVSTRVTLDVDRSRIRFYITIDSPKFACRSWRR